MTMKHRILAAFAAIALAGGLFAPANAQSPSAQSPAAQTSPFARRPATMTVTGTSTISRAPDRATISFSIETTNEQAAVATSANSTIVAALQKRLAAMTIPATAISTSNYGLNYTPRPPKPDPASTQRFGYTVERTMNVAIDNVDGAGAIVDAGVAAGVTSVNGISFSLRDSHAAQRAAQTAAFADAVAQAQGVAAAANMRLVRITGIAPASGSANPIRPMGKMLMAAAAMPTTIDPGNLTVNASVTVEYEIAPTGH